MLIATTMWVLGLFGVAPTDADLQRMLDESYMRGHHITFDFGSFRGDVTRKPGLGLGWEYIADRRFHSVSVEVLGMVIGRPGQVDENYWAAAGIGYFPVRMIKLFAQAGPFFQVNSDEVRVFGRVGLGIRFPFFVVQVMPFGTIGALTGATAMDGTPTAAELVGTIGVRLQY